MGKKKAHYLFELFLISLHIIMFLSLNVELWISLSTLNLLFRYAVTHVWHIICHACIPGRYTKTDKYNYSHFADGTYFATRAALGARSIILL